ncbi:PREDICTED: transmembrane protein 56-B-like [Branchiostoma belcheri]|uniref:Transmembrane protein 56-B-like n=1 Tax=Branchiostoma belcheri TaxID=7741 RepID=A0A6P4YZK5_BRABE|nr:PREDICTED: transmembrane protein 56-B-like [Branchiostoma belcheri]
MNSSIAPFSDLSTGDNMSETGALPISDKSPSDVSYLTTVLCAIAVFFCIFKFVSPWLLQAVFGKRYVSLPDPKKRFLDEAGACTCFSTVMGCWSLYIHYLDTDINSTLLRYDYPPVRHNCCILLGFSIADLITKFVFVGESELGMMTFIVHHLVSIVISCVGVCTTSLPFYVNMGPMLEFSNPFLNMRTILKELGFPALSTPYKINGILWLLSFFFVRIVITLFVAWYKFAPLMLTSELYEQVEVITLVAIFTGGPFFNILSVYWFIKIWQGTIKVLKSGQKNI